MKWNFVNIELPKYNFPCLIIGMEYEDIYHIYYDAIFEKEINAFTFHGGTIRNLDVVAWRYMSDFKDKKEILDFIFGAK